MTLPPITVTASTYRLTASVPGRTLAVAEAYEWAIDVFESMDREEALDYLRRVAARQRQSYEREIQVDDQQLTHAAEAAWVA